MDASNPSAIDLDVLKRHFHQAAAWPEIEPIIAAVEALRIKNKNLQRVAEAKPEELNQELLDENQALRERVVELEGALRDLTHGLPGLLEKIGYSDEEELVNKALTILDAPKQEKKDED